MRNDPTRDLEAIMRSTQLYEGLCSTFGPMHHQTYQQHHENRQMGELLLNETR